MKGPVKYGLSAIILGGIGSYLANQIPEFDMSSKLLLITVIITLPLSFIYFFYPNILSYYNLITLGRFRGLWGDLHLDKLIYKEYKASTEIKIKVTRGINLFKEGTVFHKCIFDEKTDSDKIIQLLLHRPCLESKHIFNRANSYGKTPKKYIEELFETLLVLKRHSNSTNKNQKEKIYIKFYQSKRDKEWRYYVFNKDDVSKTLLFNHYQKNVPGAKSKMVRILDGKNSLCDDMERSFDYIFENESIEIIDNTDGGYELKKSNFCGHPKCQALIEDCFNKIKNK